MHVQRRAELGKAEPPHWRVQRTERAFYNSHIIFREIKMPFVGLGLHMLVALFFAVHVIRTGQQMYWLMVLFSFPLLGSLVYFLAIYLPDSRLERGARKAVTAAIRSLDPTKELREARAAFEYTPTAQNQMRLAAALLESGAAEDAATNYEACLKGPFASDLNIKLGAALAYAACGRFAAALEHLQQVRATDANFRADQVSIAMAQALAGAGRQDEARAEFASAVQRFGSFEAYAEYTIWALSVGDEALASKLQAEIDQITKRWSRATRELNLPTVRRLRAANDLAKQQGNETRRAA
jgi:hypothetical protein